MKNAEILSFFGGPRVEEGGVSICEELQGRIQGLNNAITFLTDRNESLAEQITEKDQKLVNALKHNLMLHNQLKTTDQYLRETVMRASAERSMLTERIRAGISSPPSGNQNKNFASYWQNSRKPKCRGYSLTSSPPFTSNSSSYANLDQSRTGEISTLCRKKSDWLLSYTEDNDRKKHTKMRDYSRLRLRAKTVSPESRCGQSPHRRKVSKAEERDPALGSWENPG